MHRAIWMMTIWIRICKVQIYRSEYSTPGFSRAVWAVFRVVGGAINFFFSAEGEARPAIHQKIQIISRKIVK